MKIIVQIDGGAAKGYLPLRGLVCLKNAIGFDCLKHVSLYSGTSTGALIGGFLAAGVNVTNLLRVYATKIPYLFKPRKVFNPRRYTKGVFDRSKFLKVMSNTLETYGTKDNKKGWRLKDLNVAYMATAWDLVEDRTMFFKSYAAKDGYLDLLTVMSWSALSAVNYFGAINASIRDSWHRFQDGGQSIKNCTLLDSVDECEEKNWLQNEECVILSFGCGHVKRGNKYSKVRKWGLFRQLKDFLFSGNAQDEAVFDQVRRAKNRAKRHKNLTIFRFDTTISKKMAAFTYRDVKELERVADDYCNTQDMHSALIYLKNKLS